MKKVKKLTNIKTLTVYSNNKIKWPALLNYLGDQKSSHQTKKYLKFNEAFRRVSRGQNQRYEVLTPTVSEMKLCMFLFLNLSNAVKFFVTF